MSANWLVVGVAGCTCSGKTTLCKRLEKNLKNSVVLSQDEYFLPADDSRHVFVPELNHLNWELLTSLDITRMLVDIRKILEKTLNNDCNNTSDRNILIIDGFLLFNCKEIFEICDLRYFLDVSKDECWKRRNLRSYDPPDVPNYFEKIVWPEYDKSRAAILRNEKLASCIEFIDGSRSKEEIFLKVFDDVKKRLSM